MGKLEGDVQGLDFKYPPKTLDGKKRTRARRILKAEEKAEALAPIEEATADVAEEVTETVDEVVDATEGDEEKKED